MLQGASMTGGWIFLRTGIDLFAKIVNDFTIFAKRFIVDKPAT